MPSPETVSRCAPPRGGRPLVRATITVAGRPTARLVPVVPHSWREWNEVAELFAGPADDAWDEDRDRIDGELADPWAFR